MGARSGHAPGPARLRVALAAGEHSGDALGAGLITALRALAPDARCFGIAGEAMVEAGCEPWYRAEELSVMGLAEVLRHLPRLLRLRRALYERLKADPPDVFIGIDSPDFNLPLAAALKRASVTTVQYVSPQVWAWRQSRVAGIRKAIDLVLCVLPFETAFYAEHGVRARFVGHPLADAIPLEVGRAEARAALGLPGTGPLVALLPGSRAGEVSRLARPFLETAQWLARARGDLGCVVALSGARMRELFARVTAGIELDPPPSLVTGRAREAIAAADVVLTASGTASLEAMLIKRPMVVAYRLAPLTYWVLRMTGVTRMRHFALPNLLAGRPLMPEFLQGDVRADVLGPAMLSFLENRAAPADWYDAFDAIHRELRRDASVQAARAVVELLDAGTVR